MRLMSRLKITLMKLIIKTIGQTSDGLKLVTKEGLTSGVNVDYIYRNQPQGRFIIGRWIDRVYLSHPAWQDVRTRKAYLEQYLIEAITRVGSLNLSPVIVDIASGPARYILDVVSRPEMNNVQAICQDLDKDAIEIGNRTVTEKGLSNVKFIAGDAFNAESLALVTPKPNILVSSGFYDWITDDTMVRKSMSLVYDILPPGGIFLFTNQVRHVSLEFTQGVFTDFSGKPLKMSMRPSKQVNNWAEQAGFRILQTTGDNTVNYSVSLSQKS